MKTRTSLLVALALLAGWFAGATLGRPSQATAGPAIDKPIVVTANEWGSLIHVWRLTGNDVVEVRRYDLQGFEPGASTGVLGVTTWTPAAPK